MTDKMIKCIHKTSGTNPPPQKNKTHICRNTHEYENCKGKRLFLSTPLRECRGGVEVWRHLSLTSAIDGEGRGLDS